MLICSPDKKITSSPVAVVSGNYRYPEIRIPVIWCLFCFIETLFCFRLLDSRETSKSKNIIIVIISAYYVRVYN